MTALARRLRAGGDRRDGDAEPVSEDLVQFFTRLAAVFAEEERDEFEKEVTQLRSQVDQVPAAVQQDGNPVAHIKKESELNKVAELAERRLQFAEDMEDALLGNPERVEKVLRQQGVSRKDQVVSG